jgi:hypothetical protein
MSIYANTIRAALILISCAAAGPNPATAQSMPNAQLVEALRGGGYNLYVRHAATTWSQIDRVASPDDWASCDPAQVRQLSDEGRRDARALGNALRALRIPLGRIVSSPYCRARETARLIAGRDAQATPDLMNLRVQELVGGRDAAVRNARNVLSEPPAKGANDLFAAHGNLGLAAFGEYLGEGEFMVIEPRNAGQFEVVGTLSLEDLQSLVD